MRFKIVITLFALLGLLNLSAKDKEVLSITSSFSVDSLRTSDLYLQAVKSLSLGEVEDGYNILNKILELSPQHAPSLYKISTLLQDKNQSVEYARKASDIDKTNLDYKYQLATLLMQIGAGAEASEVCKEIVNLDHNSPKAHIYLASTYNIASQPYKAIEALDSALVIFDNSEEVLMAKQQLLEQNRLYAKAAENIERLVKISPDNINYLINAAEMNSMNGKNSKAEQFYTLAEQLDPNYLMLLTSQYSYHNYRGNRAKEFELLHKIFLSSELTAKQKSEILSRAVSDDNYYRDNYNAIDKLISTLRVMHPNQKELEQLYATHLIRGGDIIKALDQYFALMEIDSSDKNTLRYLLTLEYYHYKSSDSLKSIPLAISLFPNDVDLNLLISSMYRRDNKHDKALQVAKAMIKECKTDSLRSEVYGFLGDSYQFANKSRKSYSSYEKSLKYNPDNIVVLNNYSYRLSEEGKKLDKALEMAKKVMEKEPDNATYIDTYGWILFKMGLFEEAKNTMRKAIALDKYNNPEILLHMGDILNALGDKLSAESYWTRALKAGIDKKEIEKRLDGTK